MKKIITVLFVITLSVLGAMLIDKERVIKPFDQIKHIVKPDPMVVNTYDDGQCTYYVFEQVKKQGNKIERSWWDAKYWADRAKEDGYTVNHTPKPGSIMQSSRGSLGHVSFIEKINSDGSFVVSEMNYSKPYEVTERTIHPVNTKRYLYIHPKVNPYAEKLNAA
ncbi:CHAP domain-containing protein [Macrococcus lamae]|uniref:CHAP domain-containing protein n=1 Tax=Macrococcus lamae TaxID=198484 RepID=A0A4R6BWA5_9STAP|nr:CHAP domain-containing protein [Macrococcus lamae]TDM12724.1 CHAP domain-containing protein [Macrococcus lamae]